VELGHELEVQQGSRGFKLSIFSFQQRILIASTWEIDKGTNCKRTWVVPDKSERYIFG